MRAKSGELFPGLPLLTVIPLAVVFLEVSQDWGPALTALRGCGSVLLKFELRQTAPDPFVPPTRSPGRDTSVRCIFHVCVGGCISDSNPHN